MHGDFTWQTCAPHGPRGALIVDWEMCTLGDPLLDLAGCLTTWPQDGAIGPFELTVAVEGTNARAYAGKPPKATGDQLHVIAIGLLDNATHFIERGL